MNWQFFVDLGKRMSHNRDRNLKLRAAGVLYAAIAMLLTFEPCFADSKHEFPGNGSRTDWEAANALNHQAFEMGKIGKIDAAIAKEKEAIARYPGDSTYHYNLANFYLDKNQYAAAVIEFKRAIALDPNDYSAYTNLGLAYRGLKDNRQAETSYRQSLKIQPNNFDTLYNLGNCLRDQHKFDEAKVVYDQAGRLSGADKSAMSEAYKMLDAKRKAVRAGVSSK